MGVVIIFVVIVAIAIMVVVSQRQSVSKMAGLLRQAQEKTIQLEQKNESTREELRKNREEIERAKNALNDARELNKKKLRRQGEQEQQNSGGSETAMINKMTDDSQLALNALEAQIEQLKKEHNQSSEQIRIAVEQEFNKKLEGSTAETTELKKKIANLQEELKKQKRLLRPEGNKIDLKTLADEAAGEFARVFRKAEQHERLHGIARAKLQLAQEKFAELQKRYFSVCRELAVAAGRKDIADPIEARSVAEEIVNNHQDDQNQGNV